VPICVDSGEAGTGGYAQLSTGSVPVGQWLYQAYGKPAVDMLF
jgi:hypothetical protein